MADASDSGIRKVAILCSSLDREGMERVLGSLDPMTSSLVRQELLAIHQVPKEAYLQVAEDLERPDDQPIPALEELQRQTIDQLARIRTHAADFAADTKKEIECLRREAETSLAKEAARLAEITARLDTREKDIDDKRLSLQNEEQRLAKANFEETRQKGYEEGQRQGLEQGYHEGTEKARAEYEQLIRAEVDRRLEEGAVQVRPALESMVRELTGARAALLAYWEENILQIAAALAYQTVRQHLPDMPEISLTLLRESLELAVGNTSIKVRMNPGDLDVLRDKVEQLLKGTRGLTGTEVIVDPKITAGGCVVETDRGMIDQRLESRLERMITELAAR